MSRSVRLFDLTNMLAGRRSRTLQEIVDRFEVSERTAYRDLAELGRLVPLVRDDHGYRLVGRQQCRQSPQPRIGGVPADARVDDRYPGVGFLQSSRQQGDPALIQRHAVGCADTISDDEQVALAAAPVARVPGRQEQQQ